MQIDKPGIHAELRAFRAAVARHATRVRKHSRAGTFGDDAAATRPEHERGGTGPVGRGTGITAHPGPAPADAAVMRAPG